MLSRKSWGKCQGVLFFFNLNIVCTVTKVSLIVVYVGRSSKKVFLNMCKMCRFRSSCTCTKYHPGFCSPFIHSIVSNGSEADLGLRYPHMNEDTFWHGVVLVILIECLGPYKRGYQHNIFPITPQKHMLWVLIRSASARRF